MAALIEGYALVGDMQTAAPISRDGAVDRLCVPRYGRPVGNFPQAFSHRPLIQSALNLGNRAGHHGRRAARSPRVS